jgi:metal-responsive CopG/Arc/MetJ family transcriptional regulator
MKTVQITLDEHLAHEVDRTVEKLGTTRSGFTRDALRDALAKIDREELERRHRQGYERHPVRPGEFDVWEDEQAWVE